MTALAVGVLLLVACVKMSFVPIASACLLALVSGIAGLSLDSSQRIVLAMVTGTAWAARWGSSTPTAGRLATTASLLCLGLSGIGDTDVRALCCLAGTVLLPLGQLATWVGVPSPLPSSIVGVAIASIGVTACLLDGAGDRSPKRIGYWEQGVWARAHPALAGAEAPTIAHAYSYSELVHRLGAHVISALDRDALGQLDELWCITPTTPVSESDRKLISDWVERGGHLILVADHTDLYGHASVLNSLLPHSHFSVRSSAVFNAGRPQTAQSGWMCSVLLKTSAHLHAPLCWPFLTSRGWIEPADFGGRNFFGDLRPSLEDAHCRVVVGTQFGMGQGSVTALTDSTPLANLAICEPATDALIRCARTHYYAGEAWPLLLLAAGACYLLGWTRFGALGTALCVGPVLACCLAVPAEAPPLSDSDLPVSGIAVHASPEGPPEGSISTALSLLPLDGVHARWTARPGDFPSGLWLGDAANCPAGWRCLDWELPRIAMEPAKCALPAEVLAAAHVTITPELPLAERLPMRLNPLDLWTNRETGDIWLAGGLSPARRARFHHFAGWVLGQGAQEPATQVQSTPVSSLSGVQRDWEATIEGQTLVIRLALPDPVIGEYRYFGGGLSAIGWDIDGTPSYVFRQSMQCGWGSAQQWRLSAPKR